MEAIEQHLDRAEEIIHGLEDKIDDLREENIALRRQLALSAPRNVDELITSVNEYLDWIDFPNRTMPKESITMIKTQLRGAVDSALRELR